MTILWIILALIAIIFICGETMLQIACVRHRAPDYAIPENLRGTPWADQEENVRALRQWLTSANIKPMQVVSFDGKNLAAQFIPRENARGTILFFNGYRSLYAIDFSASLRVYYDLGYNLLLCDQRCHGKSQGRYITFGAKERYDVISWTTYLAMTLGEDHPMFLAGLSMGATTVLLASALELPDCVRGVIADCGFTSARDIMSHQIRYHYHIPEKPSLALLNLFTTVFAGFGLSDCSTVDAVAETKLPILFIHGTSDHFVPCEMTKRAYEACKSEKALLLVDGADHGRSYLVETERYQKITEDFLRRHT